MYGFWLLGARRLGSLGFWGFAIGSLEFLRLQLLLKGWVSVLPANVHALTDAIKV